MADKDEFKFDDDDTFPETDLSGAFSEGEQTAPAEPEYPMTIKKSGGLRSRLLLLLLLLLVAGGGGYYYFMMMEEPPPPPSPPPRVVAAKPKPVTAPVPPPAPTAPAAGQAQVAVPPPPQSAAPAPAAVAPSPKPAAPTLAAAPAAAPVPATPAVTVAPPPKPAVPATAAAPAAAPVPAKPAVTVAPSPRPEAKPAPVATPAPMAKAVEAKAASAAKPAAVKVAPAATGGPWLVEAGTYLNASALKTAEKKIRGLGYEPQVSTTQKSVRLTRLRMGSFPESEVKEALAYARGIAPDAFAIRSGNTFTVYAGTYANQQNIREMNERLVSEGVQVEEEPIEVKRTISLLRFGGFADQSAAAEAAAKARKAGIAAEVVNPR